MGCKVIEAPRKTALVTGASSGIGCELAAVFAKHGYDLVLVARNQEKLKQMAEELRTLYDIAVRVSVVDLTARGAVDLLVAELEAERLEIDVLVNNAGAGNCGFFHEAELEKELAVLQLNIVALTHLTKLFAQKMVSRKNGKILNVASTGSYQAGPLVATYYASKAYVLSFSEAIANELKPFNVQVTTLCPGTTKTEFARRAGKGDLPLAMHPRKVAEIGYQALMKDKGVVIPGKFNQVMVMLARILPRSLTLRLARCLQEKAIRSR